MNMSAEVVVVMSTFPNVEVARAVARELVQNQFVACVNILPKCESVYRWQDEVVTEDETVVLMKTTKKAVKHVVDFLNINHPYSLPEIVGINVEALSSRYREWVVNSVV